MSHVTNPLLKVTCFGRMDVFKIQVPLHTLTVPTWVSLNAWETMERTSHVLHTLDPNLKT